MYEFMLNVLDRYEIQSLWLLNDLAMKAFESCFLVLGGKSNGPKKSCDSSNIA